MDKQLTSRVKLVEMKMEKMLTILLQIREQQPQGTPMSLAPTQDPTPTQLDTTTTTQ